ncbi:MAG: PEP-CTERM sorting domain-containing protein [Deltaproteobacteria bacterium]|nr:PEP-CTERM sorting domain-containing protein [Deltaproteobacteria bacterium]
MNRAACLAVFATVFSLTLATAASATLVGQSVEACVWSYADCLTSFTPGSNAGGTLIPPDGQATIVDPGLEFDYVTSDGNLQALADFGADSLELTLANLSFVSVANLSGGSSGWVFEFENQIITDVSFIGGTAVMQKYTWDADTITVLFDANCIDPRGAESVSLAITTSVPEPTTAALLAGGLLSMSVWGGGRSRSRSQPPAV